MCESAQHIDILGNTKRYSFPDWKTNVSHTEFSADIYPVKNTCSYQSLDFTTVVG